MHFNAYLISVDVVWVPVEESGSIQMGPKSPLMRLVMVSIATEDQWDKSTSEEEQKPYLQLACTVVRLPQKQVAKIMRNFVCF